MFKKHFRHSFTQHPPASRARDLYADPDAGIPADFSAPQEVLTRLRSILGLVRPEEHRSQSGEGVPSFQEIMSWFYHPNERVVSKLMEHFTDLGLHSSSFHSPGSDSGSGYPDRDFATKLHKRVLRLLKTEEKLWTPLADQYVVSDLNRHRAQRQSSFLNFPFSEQKQQIARWVSQQTDPNEIYKLSNFDADFFHSLIAQHTRCWNQKLLKWAFYSGPAVDGEVPDAGMANSKITGVRINLLDNPSIGEEETGWLLDLLAFPGGVIHLDHVLRHSNARPHRPRIVRWLLSEEGPGVSSLRNILNSASYLTDPGVREVLLEEGYSPAYARLLRQVEREQLGSLVESMLQYCSHRHVLKALEEVLEPTPPPSFKNHKDKEVEEYKKRAAARVQKELTSAHLAPLLASSDQPVREKTFTLVRSIEASSVAPPEPKQTSSSRDAQPGSSQR